MLEVHAILHRQRCYENMIEKTGILSDAYKEIFKDNPDFSEQEALNKMRGFFPELKRWKGL
jgi:hypothetical protein